MSGLGARETEAGVPDRNSDTRGTGRGSHRCVPEPPGKETGWHFGAHAAGPGHSGPGPAPSPWGRMPGGQSDLKADVGQLHGARDADGVDAVEGHAVCVLHEEVLVHHHLLR